MCYFYGERAHNTNGPTNCASFSFRALSAKRSVPSKETSCMLGWMVHLNQRTFLWQIHLDNNSNNNKCRTEEGSVTMLALFVCFRGTNPCEPNKCAGKISARACGKAQSSFRFRYSVLPQALFSYLKESSDWSSAKQALFVQTTVCHNISFALPWPFSLFLT